jgi:lysozyme
LIEELTEDLKRDEGRRDKPYRDTKGILTIGYGHNLEAEGLCEAALLAQLEYDIQTKAIAPLDRNLPWWREHPEDVQRVLANLMFNMGWGTLRQFKRTLKFIELGQYKAAAAALLESLYATQVGQRAERLAQILRSVV